MPYKEVEPGANAFDFSHLLETPEVVQEAEYQSGGDGSAQTGTPQNVTSDAAGLEQPYDPVASLQAAQLLLENMQMRQSAFNGQPGEVMPSSSMAPHPTMQPLLPASLMDLQGIQQLQAQQQAMLRQLHLAGSGLPGDVTPSLPLHPTPPPVPASGLIEGQPVAAANLQQPLPVQGGQRQPSPIQQSEQHFALQAALQQQQQPNQATLNAPLQHSQAPSPQLDPAVQQLQHPHYETPTPPLQE
jgi:hypothetical protein